jgi:arylsulfatase A-like enzyme
VDLNPTVMDVLGLAAPDGAWQGRSLFAKERTPRQYFFAALGDYQMGVREGNWKLIYNGTLGANQLFDLQADPMEQHDVAAAHPDLCRDLRRRIAAWLSFQNGHLTKLRSQSIR